MNQNSSFVGTPEIAGLNSMQALEIIRGCRGMNVIGGDLVEVTSTSNTFRPHLELTLLYVEKKMHEIVNWNRLNALTYDIK